MIVIGNFHFKKQHLFIFLQSDIPIPLNEIPHSSRNRIFLYTDMGISVWDPIAIIVSYNFI